MRNFWNRVITLFNLTAKNKRIKKAPGLTHKILSECCVFLLIACIPETPTVTTRVNSVDTNVPEPKSIVKVFLPGNIPVFMSTN